MPSQEPKTTWRVCNCNVTHQHLVHASDGTTKVLLHFKQLSFGQSAWKWGRVLLVYHWQILEEIFPPIFQVLTHITRELVTTCLNFYSHDPQIFPLAIIAIMFSMGNFNTILASSKLQCRCFPCDFSTVYKCKKLHGSIHNTVWGGESVYSWLTKNMVKMKGYIHVNILLHNF
jgi:hypothetical protein